MSALRSCIRYISFALLTLVLALHIPSELYHDCEHNSGEEQNNTVSFSQDHQCAICDFHILPHYRSFENFECCTQSPIRLKFTHWGEVDYNCPFLHFSSRGPPAELV